MDELEEPPIPSGIGEALMSDDAGAGLAGEVFLFLHAGGLPISAVADQLEALRCFGKPNACFDLDGPMWSALSNKKTEGFADYLTSLVDRTDKSTGILSAIIDYQDLLWLEQRPAFEEQLRQRLRIIRLAFLDPALQAYRRPPRRAARLHEGAFVEYDDALGFAEIARELVRVEEAEQLGDLFCKRHGLPTVKLWIEDLARPGVPALRGLLARWAIPLPDDGRFLPIEPPSQEELETVAVFRAEASRRHWSHALLPSQS